MAQSIFELDTPYTRKAVIDYRRSGNEATCRNRNLQHITGTFYKSANKDLGDNLGCTLYAYFEEKQLGVYVRIDNISNLWVNDVREVVRVGEEKPVEITSLTRDENGRVTSMRVSMKAAEDAPQLELREGNTYTGSISNFSATAYYVRVAGIPVEVRCPINSNYTMELMEQGDFVKFYVRAIYDGVPTGAILKIIKKKNAGM